MNIREQLFSMQDLKYRDFQSKLISTLDPESIIGVRTPQLRALAKEIAKSDAADPFLSDLPHRYFEENQLHSFIICEIKDYSKCIRRLEIFLPYVDNWATCDQLSPKVFKKYRNDLIRYIPGWLDSDRTYTVRFGIGMLMEHYLDEDFCAEYLEMAASVRSDEYYVNMMTAWYFATALAKQYDAVLPFLTKQRLDTWTHNKTVQKAIESYRITPDQKEYLRTLRIKEK